VASAPKWRGMSIEHATRFLVNSANHLIIAHVGGRLVGFVVAYQLDRLDCTACQPPVYEVDVASDLRRRGIGQSISRANQSRSMIDPQARTVPPRPRDVDVSRREVRGRRSGWFRRLPCRPWNSLTHRASRTYRGSPGLVHLVVPGQPRWPTAAPLPWEAEVTHLFTGLEQLDRLFGSATPLKCPAE
jgi:hypothetical protein